MMDNIKTYQICTRCVMDTTDPDICFDNQGMCSNCEEYDFKVSNRVFGGKDGREKIKKIVEKIKDCGINSEYDCVVGLSGGVDSTYVAYLAKKFKLKPLAVHMDNGWNTKIANKNIEKIIKKLDIGLYTYVIDWEEFKDLQLSYLKASVVDIEAVTDYAIKSVLYKVASERKIKYILSGVNLITEGVLPKKWKYNKGDTKNLLDIHKKFGHKKLKTFPLLTISKRIKNQLFKRIGEIEILNYVDYNKTNVKNLITEELGWEDYGTKHGESLFTRFYQTYILPRKFNIDKRRAHVSSLVCAGQITRKEALKKINEPIEKEDDLEKNKEFVLSKFGLTEKEFEDIMNLPIKSHYDYKNNDKLYKTLRKFYLKYLRK